MLYKAHPQFGFPFLLLCLKHGCQSRRPQDEYTDVSVAVSRAEIEVSEHLMPLLLLALSFGLSGKDELALKSNGYRQRGMFRIAK